MVSTSSLWLEFCTSWEAILEDDSNFCMFMCNLTRITYFKRYTMMIVAGAQFQ